jgi:hypothetical protein
MATAINSRILRTIFLLITIFSFSLPANAQYSGGTGEPDDPYQIATAEDLMLLGESPEDCDKHFILTANIDLDPNLPGRKVFDKAVIGNFVGEFDGNGRKISHLIVKGGSSLGLFGTLSGKVRDLGVVDVNITGTFNYVGGLAGWNEGSVIEAYANGIVSGVEYIGGLVGRNNTGTVVNSHATGTIFGGNKIGGLIGYSKEGMISGCWAAGDIEGYSELGGLVGINSSAIVNCYASTSITGNGTVGGLVGTNDEATIVNSYAAGPMTIIEVPFGRAQLGGLVGYNNRGATLNSFWDVEITGIDTRDGGRGMTTAQMHDPNTFLGWSYEWAWTIDPGNDYPRLWWEGKPGQSLTTQLNLEGDGTVEDSYRIYTAEELDAVGAFFLEWDKHFILMADIDLSDYGPTESRIIGASGLYPFRGTFEGGGHTITSFRHRCSQRGWPKGIGLFGYLDGPVAEIRNLGLVDPNIETGESEAVGALVGQMEDGEIIGCWIERGVVSTAISGNAGRETGGLVGLMYKGAIANSTFHGSVSGWQRVGGLVGLSSGGNITECGAQVTVRGDMGVGGLVGASLASITGCYAMGEVVGDQNLGGLAGDNILGAISRGTINRCYSSCEVRGDYLVGGLVGNNSGGTVTDSYATGAVTGSVLAHCIGGLVGESSGVGENAGGISTSYATGDVSGDQQIGGLVGQNSGVISNSYATGDVSGFQSKGGLAGANTGTVINCYSTGLAEGRSLAGGLIGAWDPYSHHVTGCFWDTQTSDQTKSAGGEGKTTAEMQTASTFINAGWDFVDETENGTEDIWWIDEGQNYPRLWWEAAER